MAGLQNCCRRLLISNTYRFISRNGTLLQPRRSRHHLVFQISSPHNRTFFQKKKLLFNSNRQELIFRLASTNVNTPKSETTAESVAPSSNAGAVSNSETGVVRSSNSDVIIDDSTLPAAPEVNVDEIPVMEFISTGLKEPSFESIGLGSWWPPGMIQQIFEYLHINLDMPWWQAIMAVTLCARILMFPVYLSVRRDTVKLTNSLPEISRFQQRITDARLSGDYYAVATATQEMQKFMKEKELSVFGFFKTMFIQGPIFISMFSGLRGMANAPVESLKTGGLFWFTDLTVPDPYFLLPVILSTSMFLVIELGAEGNAPSMNPHKIKWFMRAIPLVVFGFSLSFPSCVTLYWSTSNLLVLGQTGLLHIPAVVKFFNLPKKIKHDPSQLARKNQGFIEGFKEGFSNAKITGQIEDRERLNMMEFQKAGTGAVPRTFKRNPLLQKEKK